jgi:hypothetical protein
MTELATKLGEMEYDNLLIGTIPPIQTAYGIIRKLSTAATIKRGTILARSFGSAGDGKLVVLGTTAAANETLTPNCILCDDIEVGTTADELVAVYTGGCFNADRVTVKDNYSITETDKDDLRVRDIVLKAAAPAV